MGLGTSASVNFCKWRDSNERKEEEEEEEISEETEIMAENVQEA